MGGGGNDPQIYVIIVVPVRDASDNESEFVVKTDILLATFEGAKWLSSFVPCEGKFECVVLNVQMVWRRKMKRRQQMQCMTLLAYRTFFFHMECHRLFQFTTI